MGVQPVLAGDLTFIDLSDLLQFLNSDAKSGVIRLFSLYVEKPGCIYVLDGNPIDAFWDGKRGEEALYSFFGWGEGRFEFTVETFPEDRRIQKTTMAIILDALKRLDEGLIEKIGPIQFSGDKMRDDAGRIQLPVVRGPAFADYLYLADEESFKSGDCIIEQGRHGNWLWVVLDGVVEMRQKTPDGDAVVARVGRGAFVGSLSSLMRLEHPRSASFIAENDVLLGVIDTRQLTMDLGSLSSEFLNLIYGIENRLVMIAERAVALKYGDPPMGGLSENIKPVIRQGDRVSKFFSVEAGNAYIIQTVGGKKMLLGTLGPGDFIGRLPMFKHIHEPNVAAVFASPDLKLSIQDKDALMAEYETIPSIIKNIMEYTSVCLSVMTDLASRDIL